MLSKLKMCWFILSSKEYIAVTEKVTYAEASTNLIGRTMSILGRTLIEEAITIHKMDSAVDEVNQILKGK